MFKHYLTYQFAVSFHRSCSLIEAPALKKERLYQSAREMLFQFSSAIRATRPEDELKFLCVALLCLRDCKETLMEIGPCSREIGAQYEILHSRLEQICLKASEKCGGQFRMLG